jgi:hypothetical protein
METYAIIYDFVAGVVCNDDFIGGEPLCSERASSAGWW